jgi:hypothetical protein
VSARGNEENPGVVKTFVWEKPMAEEKSRDASQGEGHHMIPVWFFVGMLLLIYGILILIQGISEWPNPPHTELSNLHPTVWWSFVLIVLGGIFCWKHFPKKQT